MSLKHVTITGDHFELGVALGKLGRDAIRTIVPQMERVIQLKNLWSGSDRLKQIEAAARIAFPKYMREMDGIAEGAGVAFEDILIWNCRGDLPLDREPLRDGGLGCTTIMSAADGVIEICHNEDGHKGLKGLCHFVTLQPTDDTMISSFYYPGLISGHNFGFNEFGLVQTVNNIRPHDQKVGLPRHIVSRASLASPSLDIAVAVFQRTDRASGFHYALAQSGDRRLLSVEAPATVCVVREVSKRSAHANHLVFEELGDISQDVTASSRLRQDQAEKMLSEGGNDGPAALEILGNSDHPDYPVCLKRTDRDETSYTLATARFTVSADCVNWEIYDHPSAAPVLSGVSERTGSVAT